MGPNADRIMTIENTLFDLDRQKGELKDVLDSHTKYINES